MIKVICGVCKRFLRWKDGNGVSGISHSYCPECEKEAMAEIENFKLES
jgi:hypothetical protein